MKENVKYLIILILFAACDSPTQQNNQTLRAPDTLKSTPSRIDTSHWHRYENDNYNLSLKYPTFWSVNENKKGMPWIKFYVGSKGEEVRDIQEIPDDSIHSYVGIFPKGYGTELPFGKSMSLREYNAEAPVDFQVDPIKSKVFLLNDGSPWAYFIKPQSPVESWDEGGFIFFKYKISNYRQVCIDRNSGNEKEIANCDPMMGDKIQKFGTIKDEEREVVRSVVSSIYFTGEIEKNRKALSDLIIVQEPAPNQSIRSPLKIKGKARGNWYFEADFPVVLVNKNDKKLASAIATAKGEWMTEDFVPFEVALRFKTPNAQRGFLIFQKANPSGLPENDRSLRIPVIFE